MLRPLANRLLVETLERVKSEVLVVVSDEKPNMGYVRAIGPGKRVKGRVRPVDVPLGALVRFGSGEGYLSFPEYREGARRFLVLSEADVCWIAEEPTAVASL